MFDGMEKSRFSYVIFIRTTAEKLWPALIQPGYTVKYWCETTQDSAWAPGSSWRILKPDGSVADSGEVLEFDPPRRLAVSWQNHLFPEMEAEGHSRMSYELEQQDDAVKLTLIHEMERADSKLIAAVSNGWPPILSSLKSLLETGEPLECTRHWPKDL
jgi:uncharacterized protein YndB with AHSA1/START domain